MKMWVRNRKKEIRGNRLNFLYIKSLKHEKFPDKNKKATTYCQSLPNYVRMKSNFRYVDIWEA